MLAPTPLVSGRFVAVDIETTGCRPGSSSIIEIGAARIEDGAVVDRFSTLVRSSEPIPGAIERLTGISDAMVAGAPPVEEAIAAFSRFAAGAVLVAHNHRFDLGFLDYEAERLNGAPFPRPILDTLCLARRLHPEIERNNLRDLAVFYGVDTVPNHRALPDALATAGILVAMLSELEGIGVATAGDAARLCGIAEASVLASKLPLATTMPDGPGVYVFRDDVGRVLYVGRARNLRTKVRSHFYATEQTHDTPAGLTTAVSYVECTSPLDAELIEASLRYRYRPEFNRSTTTPRVPLYLHLDLDSPFPALRVTRRRLRAGATFGPVTNSWAAHTTADALSRVYGLRRCRRAPNDCALRPCRLRASGTCVPDSAYAAGPDVYRHDVLAAVGVLRGDDTSFPARLQGLRDRYVRNERFEDAAYYRDAARAVERTAAALAMGRRARAHPVSVIVEGDPTSVTLVVTVNGWRFSTVRLTRERTVDRAHEDMLRRTLARAIARAASSPPITPKRLEEMALIDAYVQQNAPLVIPVDGAVDDAAASVAAVVRRAFRIPRRRHASASDA